MHIHTCIHILQVNKMDKSSFSWLIMVYIGASAATGLFQGAQVCICIHVCIYVCVCLLVFHYYAYIYVCMYVCMCVSLCMYITCVTYVCIYVLHTYVYTTYIDAFAATEVIPDEQVHVYVWLWVYVHACCIMFSCMYVSM
jgi:hypothetical protein